jgi:heme o synthase
MLHNRRVNYVKAAQPRIVALFLLTVLAAMLLAGHPHLALVVSVLAATGLTVAGAAILNNCFERDLDKRMRRTRERPTATGSISPGRALAAGLAAIACGTGALWASGGTLPALLALGGAAYYALAYTLLFKPHTAMSAIPGSLAGVFPPLIGWAAAGAPWSPTILYLCMLIVVWSPPHSWALALACADDYISSGIPTPAASYGKQAARRQIVAAMVVFTALTLAPFFAGLYGTAYLVVALAAAIAAWYFVLRLYTTESRHAAWAFFKFSGPYLAVLVAAMVLDRLP